MTKKIPAIYGDENNFVFTLTDGSMHGVLKGASFTQFKDGTPIQHRIDFFKLQTEFHRQYTAKMQRLLDVLEEEKSNVAT
jgi:hypothetical protein